MPIRTAGGGRHVDDELLAHISPAHSENVNFFGAIEVDIDAELAQLGPPATGPYAPATPCSDRRSDRRYGGDTAEQAGAQ